MSSRPSSFPPARMGSALPRPILSTRAPRVGPRLRASTRWTHACVLCALFTSATAHAVAPNALPQGETVRLGHVEVVRDEREMRIVQASERAIIDWRAFDIGAQASVHVLQGSTEMALLNRVSGTATSELAGALHAGGHVYLVNPNGIRVAPSGSVDAASFVASTLDIGDRDFRRGMLRFGSAAGGGGGTVVQEGRITIDPGGLLALLGERIEQRGEIRVPLGQVALGAGTSAALTPDRPAFLTVARAAGTSSTHDTTHDTTGGAANDGTGDAAGGSAAGVANAGGSAAPAAIVIAGDIDARGGQVQVAAPIVAPPGSTSPEAILVTGSIRAPGFGHRGGAIHLDGMGGVVRLSGLLDATNNGADAARLPGGTVALHGARVVIERMGINVSGAAGGGRVVLSSGTRERPTGGTPTDLAAQEPSIWVDAAAAINANATQHGRGGDIHVLSDGPVVLVGRMQARSVVPSMAASADVSDGGSLPYCQRISFHAGRAISPLELPRAHPLATPFARPGTRLFARQEPRAAAVDARQAAALAMLSASSPVLAAQAPTPASPLPYSFASRLASPLRIPEASLRIAAAAAAEDPGLRSMASRLGWSPDPDSGPLPDYSSGPSASPSSSPSPLPLDVALSAAASHAADAPPITVPSALAAQPPTHAPASVHAPAPIRDSAPAHAAAPDVAQDASAAAGPLGGNPAAWDWLPSRFRSLSINEWAQRPR